MSQESATTKTAPSDGERSKRRSEKRRLDAGHYEELLENAPQALHEPALCEGQEALQEATSKEEDEHPRGDEDNPDGAITKIRDKVKKMLAELQEYRREQELRIPEMREAFLTKMAEVFDLIVEEARPQWNALHAEIRKLVSEIDAKMQRIGP